MRSVHSTRPEGSPRAEAGWCWHRCWAPALQARCHCSSPESRPGGERSRGVGSAKIHTQTQRIQAEQAMALGFQPGTGNFILNIRSCASGSGALERVIE